MTKQAYFDLCEIGKDIKYLESVSRLLEWDRETMMPKNSAQVRGLQLETLSSHIHSLLLSDHFLSALEAVIDLTSGAIKQGLSLTPKESACLKLWRRDVLKARNLPSTFVKEFAKATSDSVIAWDEAKPNNDFKSFLPHLEKVIALSKQKIELQGYDKHPYDALLDDYEIGMTTHQLDPIFSKLKPFLIDLTKKLSCKSSSSLNLASHLFSETSLKELGHLLLEKMGFTPGSFRLDSSSHPFCNGINPQDIRMTVHKTSTDIMKGHFSALMHEAGHGLYEMHLPKEDFGSPLAEATSIGIHESQSKLWETLVGNSLTFVEFFHPQLSMHFPEVFKKISIETLFNHVNDVRPSFIRIHADEVTYSLHVILRYEIEKALFEGSLKAKDIPDIWNHKMNEYLGITPKTYKEGCMQDIHWSAGFFGYFPTYVLGNLYASEFFGAIEKAHPDAQHRIKEGDFLFISNWLKTHVHQYGREFTPSELLQKATSATLSEQPFINYLKKKFV